MNQRFQIFIKNPLRVSAALFITVLFMAAVIDWRTGYNPTPTLLNGLHGVLISLVVSGGLILWVDKFRERHSLRREYCDQLDDFRLWSGAEASYRKSGIIKRLVQLDLGLPEFNGMDLTGVQLQGLNLKGTRFGQASLQGASLANADLTDANFYRTVLVSASLFMAKGLTKRAIEQAILDRNSTILPDYLFTEQGFSWDEYEQSDVFTQRFEWRPHTPIPGTGIPLMSDKQVRKLLRGQHAVSTNNERPQIVAGNVMFQVITEERREHLPDDSSRAG